jgi:hypothetical protein
MAFTAGWLFWGIDYIRLLVGICRNVISDYLQIARSYRVGDYYPDTQDWGKD